MVSNMRIISFVFLAFSITFSPAQAKDDHELEFSVPKDPQQPLIFNYRGKQTSDPKSIPIVANSIFSEEVAKVSPVSQKVGGTARLLLGVDNEFQFAKLIAEKQGASRGNEAQRFLEEYYKVADYMFVEAVKRAKVFDSLSVEKGKAVPTSSNDSDFVLWRENSQWFIRSKNGPRNFVYTSPKGLPGQMEMLPRAAGESRNAVNSDSLFTTNAGRKKYFHFAGKEVSSADEAIGIIDAFYADKAKQVKNSPIKVKGRLLISGAPKSAPNDGRPQQDPEQERVSNAMFAAIDRALFEAIGKSDLFEQVVVQTTNKAGTPQQGFDFEIWHASRSPKEWLCKAGQAEPFTVDMSGDYDSVIDRFAKDILARGFPERTAQ